MELLTNPRGIAALLGLGVAAWWTSGRPPRDRESGAEQNDTPEGGDRYSGELLSSHFTLNEMTVTSTGLSNTPDAATVEALRAFVRDVLQPLRTALGSPIVVTSGYRSPAVNSAVGGVSSSRHMLGRAADLAVPEKFASSLAFAQWIESTGVPFTFLQSYHPGRSRLAGSRGWVHIDYLPSRPERAVWYALRAGGSSQDRTLAIGEYADEGRAV